MISLKRYTFALFLSVSLLCAGSFTIQPLFAQDNEAQEGQEDGEDKPENNLPDRLNNFEKNVAAPKIDKALNELAEIQQYLTGALSDGGDLVNGDPGVFSLGTPVSSLKKIARADYEWLTLIPEDVIGDEDQKIQAIEYDYFGAPVGQRTVSVSDQKYFAQTAACNRADFPRTHGHTYGALYTPSNYKVGWQLFGTLPGEGMPFPEGDAVRERVQEVGPGLALVMSMVKSTPPTCSPPLAPWRTVECVHSAGYKPWQYDELGFASGVCIDIAWPIFDYIPTLLAPFTECCPRKIKITNSVDYLFPTAKVSMSKQQMVSRYLPAQNWRVSGNTFSSVTSQLQKTAQYLQQSGILKATQQLNIVLQAAGLAPATETPDSGGLSEDTPTWFFPWGEWDYPWSRSSSRGFFRHLLNLYVMNDYSVVPFFPSTYNYPHVWPGWGPEFWPLGTQIFGQSQFFTDALAGPFNRSSRGLELSFWLNESRKIDSNNYQRHLQEPERCARNNAATEKTPEDYLLSVCPEADGACDEAWTKKRVPDTGPRDFQRLPCLDNVGEVFPPIAVHRGSNSDYVLQTLAKGFQQYHSLYNVSLNRFSFDRDLDRFHFFPSGALGSDDASQEDPENEETPGATSSPSPSPGEGDDDESRRVCDPESKDVFSRDNCAKFRRTILEEEINGRYKSARDEILEQQEEDSEEEENEEDNQGPSPEELLAFYEDPNIPYELNDKFNLDNQETIQNQQCGLFHEYNTKPNYGYQYTNKNTPEILGGHGETTAQVFTNFSGCYGFPGREHWYLDPFGFLSGIFRLLPSYWENREEHVRVR